MVTESEVLMLYLYDRAITQDLIDSFNPNHVPDPTVRVVDPEEIFGLAAQLHDDNIKFPIVALSRMQNTPIDSNLTNFTRLQVGALSCMDTKTNELYYEHSAPVDLKYSLTILTTRVADMDELVKEIIFKYTTQYFLTIELPYECKRQLRFAVEIDGDRDIERETATKDYIQGGVLHQTIIPLKCRGCVLVYNRPVKLQRTAQEVSIN